MKTNYEITYGDDAKLSHSQATLLDSITKDPKYDYKKVKYDRNTVSVDTLVKLYVKLAIDRTKSIYSTVGAFRKEVCMLSDLLSEALYGLTIAAQKYIDTKDGEYANYPFYSYAVRWIDKYIYDYITYKSTPITCNTVDSNHIKKTGDFIPYLFFDKNFTTNAYNSTPNDNITSNEYSYKEYTENNITDNIIDETFITTDGIDFDINTKFNRKNTLVNGWLQCLTFDEQSVIIQRFGLFDNEPLTERLTAKKLNLKVKTVKVLYTDAIEKLKCSSSIKLSDIVELSKLTEENYNSCEYDNIHHTVTEPRQNNDLCKYISKYILSTEYIDSMRGIELQTF